MGKYQVDEYTVSLLHFEDGVKDETGKEWKINGAAIVSAARSKFGTSALYLDSNGSSISMLSPLVNLYESPYTIELWFYPTSFAGGVGDQYGVLVGFTGFNDTYTGGAINLCKIANGNRKPGMVSTIQSLASSDLVALNSWNHVALTFDGTVSRLFLNGKLQSTDSSLITVEDLGTIVIGTTAGGYTFQYHGYIDELRISNVARWSSDFTPGVNAPTLIANAGDSKITLSWTIIDGAIGYNVKRSTTAGGPYTTIASNVPGTSYVDTDVVNGTTYYYVVTAITADGVSDNSNEASATPNATETPGENGQGLLRVTMTDSSEREYKLSIAEINDFMAWMDRPATAGTSFYTFNKSITDSKEYLLFDKIISFEVAKFK